MALLGYQETQDWCLEMNWTGLLTHFIWLKGTVWYFRKCALLISGIELFQMFDTNTWRYINIGEGTTEKKPHAHLWSSVSGCIFQQHICYWMIINILLEHYKNSTGRSLLLWSSHSFAGCRYLSLWSAHSMPAPLFWTPPSNMTI